MVPKIPLNRKQSGQGSVSDRLYVSAVNSTNLVNANLGNTSVLSNASMLGNRSTVRDDTIDEKLNQSNVDQNLDIKKIRIFQIEKPA